MLPKTVILLKMQVADVSVDAKKFSESAITRAKHRWVRWVALGTRWREISSLWDLVLVSNWDLYGPRSRGDPDRRPESEPPATESLYRGRYF